MKNPIRVRVNQSKKHYFDVYLYDNKKMFDEDEDEIMRGQEVVIMYAGESSKLSDQVGKMEVGSKVTFEVEGSLGKIRNGEVLSFKTTPYIEVKEDYTDSRFGVHRRYVKSIEPTVDLLADLFIQRLGEYQFRKYDLGAVKIREKTFITAKESLYDLAKKGDYIIMTMSEV